MKKAFLKASDFVFRIFELVLGMFMLIGLVASVVFGRSARELAPARMAPRRIIPINRKRA